MRILITAGPTREYFDSVRFISNPSSGKMGYAIAAQAKQRGHTVVLVSGPVTLSPPDGVTVIQVTSAEEMLRAVIAQAEKCHCVVMTAAVCDYRPTQCAPQKVAKSDKTKNLELQPTVDILAQLGQLQPRPALIGFAMEDHDPHEHAQAKLQRKGCDAIVLNGPKNVGRDTAEIEIFRPDQGWSPPQSGSKRDLAVIILDLAEDLVEKSGQSDL